MPALAVRKCLCCALISHDGAQEMVYEEVSDGGASPLEGCGRYAEMESIRRMRAIRSEMVRLRRMIWGGQVWRLHC